MRYIITLKNKDNEEITKFWNVTDFYIDENSLSIHYDFMDIEIFKNINKIEIEVQ